MIPTQVILGPQVEKHTRVQTKVLTSDGEKRKCYRIHMGQALVEFYLVASFLYEVRDDISVNEEVFVAKGVKRKEVREETEVVGKGEDATRQAPWYKTHRSWSSPDLLASTT